LDPALAGILHDLRRSVVALNAAATKTTTQTVVQRAASNLSGQTPASPAGSSSSSSSGTSVSTSDVVAAVLADDRISQLFALVNLVGTDEGLEGSINKLADNTQVALDDKQPLNAGLTDISGLSKSDGQVIIGDGSHFVGESGTTLHAHLGLEIGADVQAHSVSLDNLTTGYTGWGVPTGTIDRTALPAYAGQTASATYTQSELQAVDDAVKKVSQVLAALITDLRTAGVLKT
jgi:hypothetical protein